MQQTFRLRKAIQHQGIAFTALYLPLAVASGSLFFVEDPEKHGFRGVGGVEGTIILGAMCVGLFGLMSLVAICTWAAYYAERLTIDGTKVRLRTMIHNHQFDVAELRSLKWKSTPRGGNIVCRLFASTARLNLAGYEKVDRLQIIRALRELVPDAIQENWPLFCYKIALPLRDGHAKTRSLEPGARPCTITRQRYDRTFAVLVPLAVAILLPLAAWFNLWQMLVLPVVLALAWLYLRFHVPRAGYSTTHMASTSSGRLFIATFAIIVVTDLMMIGLRLYGVEREAACSAGCVVIVPAVPVFFFFLWKAEKRRQSWEQQAAEVAQSDWEMGEACQVREVVSMNG